METISSPSAEGDNNGKGSVQAMSRHTHRRWGLFLDDQRSPKVFPMGEAALSRPNLYVIWCKDVETALTYMRCYGPPEVVYLDYNLLGIETGIDALQGMREMYPDNPPPEVDYLTGDWEGQKEMRRYIEEWRAAAGEGL